MAMAASPAHEDVGEAQAMAVTDRMLVVAVVVGAVLRLWDLGTARPSVDETYTALAVRLPVGEMLRHLDATDPHPPLAYLLLRPVAALTTSVVALRTVSVVASILAVVVMAMWRRRAGVAGVVATAMFAVSPFQVLYARQIRMYGLLALGGVVAVACAHQWLGTQRTRWAVGAAGAGLVVAASHSVGLLVLVSLFAVPALRRDRPAWTFRWAVVAALAVFGMAFGVHTLRWSHETGGLPAASPTGLVIVLNELVAPVPDQRWLVIVGLVAGATVVLWRRDDLSRVWGWMFLFPIAVLYVASLSRGVLVPKSLMSVSWGVPLALGALVGWAWERLRLGAYVLAALFALTTVPYLVQAITRDEGTGALMARIVADIPDGQPLVVSADEWQAWSIAGWYGSELSDGRLPDRGEEVDGMVVFWPSGAERSARGMFLTIRRVGLPSGLGACGAPVAVGAGITSECVELPTSALPGASRDD